MCPFADISAVVAKVVIGDWNSGWGQIRVLLTWLEALTLGLD